MDLKVVKDNIFVNMALLIWGKKNPILKNVDGFVCGLSPFCQHLYKRPDYFRPFEHVLNSASGQVM